MLNLIRNPPLDRAKLVSRLRELERLHQAVECSDAPAYAGNVAAGRADAIGNVADWIEAGDFDAPPAGKDLAGEVERLRAATPAEPDAIKGLTHNQQELLAYVAWALEEEQTVNDDHIVALLDALKDRAFLVSDLAGELHRVSTYLEVWMHDHPEDATPEFSAAIFCAKRLLARQALAALGEGE